MRKKTLGILGGIVLVAVLAVAAVLLLRSDPGEDSSDSTAEESSGEVVALTQQDPNDVTSIDVTNSSGSYEVVRTAEAAGDDNAVFAIAGWEDLTFQTATLWTLPNNTASLSTVDLVEENCTDPEKFGLGTECTADVTLHFADGSSFQFQVGNPVSGTENTYITPANADNCVVYTVKTSLVSNFSKAALDFLSTTVLEEPAEEDYPIVNFLTVERKDMDYVLKLEYDKSSEDSESMGGTVASHEMVSPVPAYLSVDRSTPVVTGMFGLTADSVAVPHPTESDLREAGLEDPFGTVVMDCADGNAYQLIFGEKLTETQEETGTSGTYYYVYLEGNDMIFKIAEENLTWATVTPTDIASKLVIGTYVWDVGDLLVQVGDTSFQFGVTATGKDDAVVTRNGESTDAERYRQFYSFLLNTTAETVELNGTPSGDVLAEISIRTQDGTFSRDLQFYEIDDFTCLITVDGKSAYTCRRSFLDTLSSNMQIYDTDEEFITNWS